VTIALKRQPIVPSSARVSLEKTECASDTIKDAAGCEAAIPKIQIAAVEKDLFSGPGEVTYDSRYNFVEDMPPGCVFDRKSGEVRYNSNKGSTSTISPTQWIACGRSEYQSVVERTTRGEPPVSHDRGCGIRWNTREEKTICNKCGDLYGNFDVWNLCRAQACQFEGQEDCILDLCKKALLEPFDPKTTTPACAKKVDAIDSHN
jgi:hypothetical protein